MKVLSVLTVVAASAALGACGSHKHAPVAYGTDPASTGRIYNSPADYSRVNRAARATQLAAAASTSPRPAQVTKASIEKSELPPAPTYISLTDPELLPQSDARVVTVRAGDTVYAIARRTGASPDAIIAENNLRAPYALEVGQTLRIPDPAQKIANDLTRTKPVQAAPVPARTHVVRRGDTLYSVSRSTGASVQAIAQANRLRAPYALQIGDRLTIPAGVGAPAATHAAPKSADVEDLARTVSYTPPTPSDPARMFDWPVKGAIISSFGSGDLGRRNDGVNIAAPVGTPVRAAADGEVVYRGSELEGYGNLLLVKHTDGFVTAYAHNDVMLVKKGQKVNQGQVIAKVGKSGAVSEPQLHFEIRQNLKSVDPIGFLDN